MSEFDKTRLMQLEQENAALRAKLVVYEGKKEPLVKLTEKKKK